MVAVLSDKRSIAPLLSPINGDGPHRSSNGPLSPPLASPFASGAMTPSFAPNTDKPIDYLSAGEPVAVVDDIELPEGLDMDLPISELLKIGTQRAHADAEHSEGAKELMRGTLGLEEYIRWNVILWRVYDALELALSEHNDNPVLAPTYDPRTLSRSNVLAQDISYLISLLPSSSTSVPSTSIPLPGLTDPSAPLPPFPVPHFLLGVFSHPPPALKAYLTHIKHLSSTSQLAHSLLAHAYVRYLGDMSGGQFIAARIKRSYSLKGMDGLRFFHFDQQGRGAEELESEGGGETKKRLGELKDWYRRGMNEGVGDDREMKTHLVKEANLAFALNTQLFSLIQPTGSTSFSLATTPQSPSISQKISSSTIGGSTDLKSSTSWRGGILEKVILVILAFGLGQLIKRGIPFIGEKWAIMGK